MTAPDYSETGDAELPDTVQLYLREIGRVPLLTADEERELCARMARGHRAERRLSGVGVTPLRKRLLQAVVSRGHTARAHLITANLRLVVSIAKNYTGHGLPMMDLIQEGNIGLMRAVGKFDYRKGNRFSTYATWWIWQAVTRALMDKPRMIRLPVHVGEGRLELIRVVNKLCIELERQPTHREIADALGVSVERVRTLLLWMHDTDSLNRPVGEDRSGNRPMELGDLLPAPAHDAEQSAHAHEVQRDLAAALDGLTERERHILCLRYGLTDGQHRTLEAVGRELGITRERARQVEAEALERLRKGDNTRRRPLRPYLEVMG